MSEPAIQVDRVWKKFRKGEIHDSLRELIPAIGRRLFRGSSGEELRNREFWALADVSFEVRRGESLGIIGPNGAGKSTMLKLLSKIIRPNRGTYQTRGRLSALIEVGSGFHQDLSGRENIYLNGTILGMKRAEIRRKEEAIIDFAGVGDFIDTPVKRYSSGMKARLGFAVAAHMDPDILLVDEVLSVGDAKFRNKCIRHMRQLMESEVTVVFISHLLDQVRSLCRRTVVLNRGRLVYDGSTDEAIRVYLDALSDDQRTDARGTAEGEVRNIRFTDAEGAPVDTWVSGQPAGIAFDLVLYRPVPSVSIQFNVNTVGGGYLGSARVPRDFATPSEPGVYPMRFTLDPMPLADADYSIECQLWNRARREMMWATPQPRMIAVRGAGTSGALLRCDGRWELQTAKAAPADPCEAEAR